ncbi:MAG TPA: heparan-alpha-glucosaminide N-acetyltransferase domain-containing protein [Magnetospirillaceae bacterium]|nr:heparan-alpha-glucosaminide N-acetyltransferase domain-containing protein [Magnetospirillaceae bacterium]
MEAPSPRRWEALDLLRGLSVIGMILNLFPGDWAARYAWLDHAKWNGVTLIDMVAPAFLFCAGAGLVISFGRRLDQGMTRGALLGPLVRRMLILIAIGVIINGIPHFDLAHWRLPGVVQRIGLACLLTGAIILACAGRQSDGKRKLAPLPLVAAGVAILVFYAVLLLFVPVPGLSEPRLDQYGSWPSQIDRAVFGSAHLWEYGFPPDSHTVVYDPDGLLSTLPVCFNLLMGAVTALLWKGAAARAPLRAAIAGGAMVGLAFLLDPVLPINKSLWTSSFALLSTGFSLVALAMLACLPRAKWLYAALIPVRAYGTNPLLAFILCWSLFPWLDVKSAGGTNLREAGQSVLVHLLPPQHASMLFGLIATALLALPILYCQRKGWFLRL